MKVEELRILIKEVVRETMREELSSILTEAVKIASVPETQPAPRIQFQTPQWVTEMQQQTPKPSTPHPVMGNGQNAMMKMLQETAANMTHQDLNNFQ